LRRPVASTSTRSAAAAAAVLLLAACGESGETAAAEPRLDLEAVRLCFQHETEAVVSPKGSDGRSLLPVPAGDREGVLEVVVANDERGDSGYAIVLFFGEDAEDARARRDRAREAGGGWAVASPWTGERGNVVFVGVPLVENRPPTDRAKATLDECLKPA
jgi:hypothetical protein